MKSRVASLIMFSAVISTTTYAAMPSNIESKVYLVSYGCGDDSCYITAEPYDVSGISISAWCGDRHYCSELHHFYETNNKAEADVDLAYQPAFIKMKKVDNPYSGQYIYEVTKIELLE